MHRAFVFLAALFLLAWPVMAAAPRQVAQQQACNNVAITSPREGATVRGVVEIQGSASIDEFLFYKVEFSTEASPERWIAVSTTYNQPVINGRLDLWNTAIRRDGVYNLKLTVVDQRSQEICHAIVRQIQIANRTTLTPTPSPTPNETPTRLPTLPPPGTATAVRPIAVQITATPGVNRTPTPAPTRSGILLPNLSNLPSSEDIARGLQLGKIQEAFLVGMGTVVAIFGLLGLVVVVRRLL